MNTEFFPRIYSKQGYNWRVLSRMKMILKYEMLVHKKMITEPEYFLKGIDLIWRNFKWHRMSIEFQKF